MSKYILLIKLIFIINTSFSQASSSIAKLDEKYGFRNIKLGIHIDELTQLEEVKDDKSTEILRKTHNISASDIKTYRKINENLYIGDIKVKDIKYTFYKDHLYSITVYFDSKDKQTFLDSFTDLYGQADNRTTGVYAWWGLKTRLFIESYTNDNIYFYYISIPMINSISNDKAKARQKVKDEL